MAAFFCGQKSPAPRENNFHLGAGLDQAGGETGIRTPGELKTHNRFRVYRLRPLGHLSVFQLCAWGRKHSRPPPPTTAALLSIGRRAIQADTARPTAGPKTGNAPSVLSKARLNSGGLTQKLRHIGILPGKPGLVAPEMPVGRRLLINRPQQVEAFNDSGGA